MNAINKERKFLIGITFVLIFTLCSATAALSAQDAKQAKINEIVFLLDTSNSMNTTDPDGIAPDSIEEMASALPSSYAMGFVAYNSGLQSVENVSRDRSRIKDAVRRVQYTGYTNAGAGIQKALTLFTEEADGVKAIVLISDGEIMMEDEAATSESLERFERARQEAQNRGIRICTVALGGKANAPAANVYGAQNADEKIYEANAAGELPEIVKQILYDGLGVQKNSVSTGEIKQSNINIKIPIERVAYIDRAKILITSDGPMENVSAAYNAENGEISIGKRFALVDIIRPKLGEAQLQLGSSLNSSIRADLLMEMSGAIKTEVTAPRTRQGDGEKTVEVRLTPVRAGDERARLLDDPYFADKPVRVTADGELLTAKVSEGAIAFTLQAEHARDCEVRVHFEDLGVNWIAPDATFIRVGEAEDYSALLAVICAAAIAVLVLLWQRRKRVARPAPLTGVSRFDFAGVLRLCITKTPDDSDIEPRVYSLYRRFSSEPVSLSAILEQCEIKLSFAGAKRISFSPGADRSLVVTNNSECTVLHNRDLLIKDHSCIVYFDEKVYITFEDERSEMVLHYKSAKPDDK